MEVQATAAPAQPIQRQAKSNQTSRAVISASEAFEMLGIDPSTGYRSIREGTFPVPVLRVGRVIRIPMQALVRILDPVSNDVGQGTGEGS